MLTRLDRACESLHNARQTQGHLVHAYHTQKLSRRRGGALAIRENILQYSWDRMFPTISVAKLHFWPAIHRYAKYMTLLFKFHNKISNVYPGDREPFDTLTATPDIELVWRTHLLAHNAFETYRQQLNLKPPNWTFNSSRLRTSDSLSFTNAFYTDTCSEVYDLCLCWFCTASRNSSQMPGSWPVVVPIAPQLENQHGTGAEHPVSLEFARRQCQHCGMQPKRGCKQEDRLRHSVGTPAIDTQARSLFVCLQDSAKMLKHPFHRSEKKHQGKDTHTTDHTSDLDCSCSGGESISDDASSPNDRETPQCVRPSMVHGPLD